MLRRNFQIIVASSQILAIVLLVVMYVTESSLPPELLGYLSGYETILVPDRYSILELSTNIPFLIERSLGILAVVGLIRFKAWGKSVFLIYLGVELILMVLSGPHVSTGWTSFVGYIYSVVEGVILALIYFSPIRKMFPREASFEVQPQDESAAES